MFSSVRKCCPNAFFALTSCIISLQLPRGKATHSAGHTQPVPCRDETKKGEAHRYASPHDEGLFATNYSIGLSFYGEVTHQRSLPYDFDTVGNLVAAVVHVLQRSGNHLHVVVRIDAACHADADEVVAAETVLARDGVAVGQNIAYLAATDTGFPCKGSMVSVCAGNSSFGIFVSTLEASTKIA